MASWKIHRAEVRDFVNNFKTERERKLQEKVLNSLPESILIVSKKQVQTISIPDVNVSSLQERRENFSDSSLY